MTLIFLLVLLFSGVNQRELFGPPVFEQVREMKCEFMPPGTNNGEQAQAARLPAPQEIIFRSIDRNNNIATMTIATQSKEVGVKWSAVAISFLKVDANDVMIVTVFKGGQRPASPEGWMYDAAYSRHVVVNGNGVVSQSKGTCKTLSSF